MEERGCYRSFAADRLAMTQECTERGTTYLSFEPWNGGFNNARMSLETAFALAWADNRTLVLPPAHTINFHSRPTALTEFFRVEGIPTIAFDEFKTLWPSLPRRMQASRRVTWAPASREMEASWRGIEDVAVIPPDDPVRTVYCFPGRPAASNDFRRFLNARNPVAKLGVAGTPTAVHFTQSLLGPFYTMIHVPDAGALRRAIRNGVRYHDWLYEAARRVVRALGAFSAMHVRRNDFARQYPAQVLAPRQILANIQPVLDTGETVYVATDESDLELFEPLAGRYRLRFAEDFVRLLPRKAREPEFLPLIEQIVCAHGRVFVGTGVSTMSSYIYRLRGLLGCTNTEYYITSVVNGAGSAGKESPSWHGSARYAQWTREYPEAWQY